jgi:NAD(P)-dependent dehydrogenase (short-subunit alcohol dehydrogenase family)
LNSAKTIIITGAGRGIGKGLALWFADKNMQVVIAEVNKQDGQNVAETIAASGGEAVFIETDVSSVRSVQLCVERAIETFGKIDGLVNNAAISPGGSFLETTYDLWQKTMDINLTGVFLMSQAAAKWMVEHSVHGKIVNIASINSFAAEKNACSYVSSKGGVNLLTKSMAVDLAPYHINVNAVAPGAVLTEHTENYFESEPIKTALAKSMLTNRIGTPRDIAPAVEFLLSEESRYVNGTTVVVDGGYLAYVRMD